MPVLLPCVTSRLLKPDLQSATYAGQIVMMNLLAFCDLRSADGDRSDVRLNRHQLSRLLSTPKADASP